MKYMGYHIAEHLGQPQATGLLALLFASVVGAVRRVINGGWKNWGAFLGSILINLFFGLIAYLLAIDAELTGLKPVIIALVFGALGEKGGEFLLKYVIDIIKLRIK